jgi:hypothetical protein
MTWRPGDRDLAAIVQIQSAAYDPKQSMSPSMRIWLRILGIGYILGGLLNSLAFLFILVVYGGKSGIEAIDADDYAPVVGHLGGWVIYVLLGFAAAGIVTGVGLQKVSPWSWRLALLLSVVNLFIPPLGTTIGLATILTLLSKDGRALLLMLPGDSS